MAFLLLFLMVWFIGMCIVSRETEADARQRIKYREWQQHTPEGRAQHDRRVSILVYTACVIALPLAIWMMVWGSSLHGR